MLNTGVSRRDAKESTLWQILEERPRPKYFLSRKACLGILRRATERGKPLPDQLRQALEIQAGLRERNDDRLVIAFHINQRNEGINLNGVSGALMATQNAQMQTFVTQPSQDDMRPMAFAANQRDEVRDLHDVAGALGASPGMKQQTFLAAGFCAESSKSARGIGYQENCAPTLRAAEKGPSVLCLNDQGGQVMDCTENITGTLRAQTHSHQPLIYENHGYTGPHDVVPTLSARGDTGGNDLPLVEESPTVYCISGNAIDREPENGGNGLGCQEDIAYTVTTCDRHAVYSRQRVDTFQEDAVVSTESAHQSKDATDLVAQPHQQENINLIRRLTPLECERLQGFPDGWTNIPSASDSARYKALGNSVAIPCVEYVIGGIALVLRESRRRRGWRVIIILQFYEMRERF